MSSISSRRCAVVSGANRGIGHEICRQLASEGVIVVATARDEKRGLEAVEKLKQSCGGDEDIIVFHQLDVADGVSVSRLVDFVTAKFGKLDILHPPFGLRPGGKSAPMRSDGGDHRSASARSSPFFDDREGPVFNDVFGGRPKYTNSNTNNKASTMMNDFDYDFIFKSGNDSKNNNSKTSSIFATAVHSNSHRKVLEMTQQKTGGKNGIPNNEACGYRVDCAGFCAFICRGSGGGSVEEEIDNGGRCMTEMMAESCIFRDEKRGLEAVENLKHSFGGDEHIIVFHQLDVADELSISRLVDFVTTKFGKLDILVNNAAVIGAIIEGDNLILKEMIDGDFSRTISIKEEPETEMKSNGAIIQTYELAEECLNINYAGTKRMVEAFLPLLQLSHSPTIVNVSSTLGNLKERVDEVVNQFLKNCEEGIAEAKGWARYLPAYKVSKAAMNAYTRILAQKYPNFRINCVCPGYVKTDMTINNEMLTPMEGAESIVKLALLPNDGPSGLFFSRTNIMAF
nr:(+)-neomenthol dehydrogenase-like [Ipomoea batatas]